MERKELPVVKLTRPVIDFEKKCLDPISQLILVEALDYAVETSMGRLDSLGKIFPKVKMEGTNALAAVNAIRESINKTTLCKAPDEPLGKIIPTKAPPKAKKEIKPEEKPRREGPPEVWGEAYYVDKKEKKHGPFGSPTELGREFGVDVKGARDMVKQFELLGCRVTTNGEGKPLKKGEGFVVRYQPGCQLPASATLFLEEKKVPPKEEVKPTKFKEPIRSIHDKKTGAIVGWKDADGKLLPKEFWPGAKPTEMGRGSIINQSVWDGMSVEGRATLATFRGLEGKTGSKAWETLTEEEKAKLQGAAK